MWRRIVRDLARFPTAVLTAPDRTGYPVSVRCRPVPDHARRVLVLELPGWMEPRTGPAGLLAHSHDERLWSLRSFGVRGVLDQRADGRWVLVPALHVRGMGKGGPVAFLRLARSGRRNAAAYLRRGGLSRPTVPWHEFEALRRRLEREEAWH